MGRRASRCACECNRERVIQKIAAVLFTKFCSQVYLPNSSLPLPQHPLPIEITACGPRTPEPCRFPQSILSPKLNPERVGVSPATYLDFNFTALICMQ
jgi:hypothetical protein